MIQKLVTVVFQQTNIHLKIDNHLEPVGLDFWTELFSFLDKCLCLFLERNLALHLLQSTSTWLLWMIVITTNSCLL